MRISLAPAVVIPAVFTWLWWWLSFLLLSTRTWVNFGWWSLLQWLYNLSHLKCNQNAPSIVTTNCLELWLCLCLFARGSKNTENKNSFFLHSSPISVTYLGHWNYQMTSCLRSLGWAWVRVNFLGQSQLKDLH